MEVECAYIHCNNIGINKMILETPKGTEIELMMCDHHFFYTPISEKWVLARLIRDGKIRGVKLEDFV